MVNTVNLSSKGSRFYVLYRYPRNFGLFYGSWFNRSMCNVNVHLQLFHKVLLLQKLKVADRLISQFKSCFVEFLCMQPSLSIDNFSTRKYRWFITDRHRLCLDVLVNVHYKNIKHFCTHISWPNRCTSNGNSTINCICISLSYRKR